VFTACGIMHRRSCLLVTSSGALDCVYSLWYNALKKLPVGDKVEVELQFHLNLVTNPRHVELIEITNKLLLLHLVCCLYYCIRDTRSH